jgi:acetyl esterase/lipase
VPSLTARVTIHALRHGIAALRRHRAGGAPDGLSDDERYARGGLQLRATMAQLGVLYRQPDDITITPADGPVPGLWVAGDRAVEGRTVLFLHGGAYLGGSPATHRGLATAFARTGRAAVLLPDYRLAPEHRYPAAIEDALATYRWLLTAGGQDPAKLVVAGDSAGGGLALALAVAARDEGLPQPAGLALLSPWADLTASGASVAEVGDADPWLDHTTLEPAGRMYAGDDVAHPWASPVFADFTGLAPMLVHVGSDEVLLDDASRVVARARAAGVDASLGVFEGLFHVFQAFSYLPEARQSLRELGAFVRRVTEEPASTVVPRAGDAAAGTSGR